MRVLHVIDGLGGSGGAENRLVEEALRLTGRFDQTVVRLFERDFLQARLERAGIPVVPIGLDSRRAATSWPQGAVRLATLCRQLRPDLIHTSLFSADLTGQLAGLVARIPVATTLTNSFDQEVRALTEPYRRSVRRRVLASIARRVTRRGVRRFRAISDHVAHTAASYLSLPLDRFTVIPRGIEPRRAAAPGDRAVFDLPEGVPLLVNVARHTHPKSLPLLIEAFGRVRRRLPDVHLAQAGREGEATSHLHEAIERTGTGPAVHLLGIRADVPELLASADVFVFTSAFEGFGSVVVEAMASGTPVVAFDIPTVGEILDHGRLGRLVEYGDVGGLADAVVDTLLNGPVAAPEVTRALATERYDVDAVARRLADFFESVAS